MMPLRPNHSKNPVPQRLSRQWILAAGLLLCLSQAGAQNDAGTDFTPPPLPPGVEVPPDDQLQSYDDLPLDIRRELNRPHLSILFYADEPDERYAMINGFRGREGLPVGRELWIHEIRPDGVVMRIENQFFLIER